MISIVLWRMQLFKLYWLALWVIDEQYAKDQCQDVTCCPILFCVIFFWFFVDSCYVSELLADGDVMLILMRLWWAQKNKLSYWGVVDASSTLSFVLLNWVLSLPVMYKWMLKICFVSKNYTSTHFFILHTTADVWVWQVTEFQFPSTFHRQSRQRSLAEKKIKIHCYFHKLANRKYF